ncbi:MAG: hypothetical protein NW223_12775 [Hyphomicrobiaceae bacterium]|nr:hypothetical protein [Hyphomicrobiaceae bacterium]
MMDGRRMRTLGALTAAIIGLQLQAAAAQSDDMCAEARKAGAATIAKAKKVSAVAEATAHAALARVHLGSCENAKAAIAEFDKAIVLDPSYDTARAGRCSALIVADRLEDAVIECTQALKMNPLNSEALEARADAYGALAKFPLALADYEQLAALKVGVSDYNAKRAKIFLGLNRPVDAAREVAEARQRTRSSSSYRREGRKRIEVDVNEIEEALIASYRSEPQVAALLEPFAVAEFLNKSLAKAASSQEAMRLANEAVTWISLEKPSRSTASPIWRQSRNDETAASILAARARLLLREGDVQGAERDFAAAAARSKQNAHALTWEAATEITLFQRRQAPEAAAARLVIAALGLSNENRKSIGIKQIARGVAALYGSIAIHHGRASIAGSGTDAPTECDKAAGYLLDPYRVVEGALIANIDAGRTISSCGEALKDNAKPRLRFQRALGYRQQAQADQNLRARSLLLMQADLQAAMSAKYPAASFMLAATVDIGLAPPPKGSSADAYAYELYVLALNQTLLCCSSTLARGLLAEARQSGDAGREKAAVALLEWAAHLGNADAHIALAESILQRGGQKPLDDEATRSLLTHLAIAKKLGRAPDTDANFRSQLEAVQAAATPAQSAAAAKAAGSWTSKPTSTAPDWLRIASG